MRAYYRKCAANGELPDVQPAALISSERLVRRPELFT